MTLEAITRAGVYARLPKAKTVARGLGEEPHGTEESLQENLAKLEHSRAATAGKHLGSIAMTYRNRAMAAILAGGDGFALWRQAAAYEFWDERILLASHEAWMRRIALGEVPRGNLNLLIDQCAVSAGVCLSLGWVEQAERLVQSWLDVLDQGCLLIPKEQVNVRHNPTCNFVLRLIAVARGGRDRPDLGFGDAELLFGSLLAHWREPSPERLEVPLLALCDRHTHQSRWTAKSGPVYDLGERVAYVPFEALAFLRLRQQAGLANPELDHPLLNTRLGRLAAPTPVHTDELLDHVLAVVRQVLPEL